MRNGARRRNISVQMDGAEVVELQMVSPLFRNAMQPRRPAPRPPSRPPVILDPVNFINNS